MFASRQAARFAQISSICRRTTACPKRLRIFESDFIAAGRSSTRKQAWLSHESRVFSTLNDGTSKTKDDEEKDNTQNSTALKDKIEFRIGRTLLGFLWPKDPDGSNKQKMEAATLRKRRIIGSLGLMVAGKAVTIQVPYIFKYLVDALPASDHMTAQIAASSDPAIAAAGIPILLLMGYGTARASASGLQELRNAIFAHVAQDIIRSVGRKTFDHVHQMDMQFHLERNTGQLSRILDRGNRSITFVLNAMVFHIGPTLLEVSLVTGLMAYSFGMQHSLVVLGTVASYITFTLGVAQWRAQFRRDMNKLENEASGRVVDSLLNYETVQYFNNTEHEGKRYEESLQGFQKAALQTQSSLSMLNFGQQMIFSLGLTGVMYLTTNQIFEGTATVGDLVLVNGLLFQLSVPLFFIGSVYSTVRQSLIDMENMYEVMDQKPRIVDKESAVTYDPETMGAEITFEDIHFAYPTAAPERQILKGTSLVIKEGHTVAFVGTSGCGKSTLLRLLYRFYTPNLGRITIGDHALEDVTMDSLRRSIAVVPQDTVLFHESIGYNIQYGNLDAPWEDVIDAAKQAKIHDTIETFPDGYNTIVGERGLKLSGGEKQRVAIARAILKRSPILLCDEPTSSLDSATEMDIMKNIKDIGKNTTTIVIAHRLSTIQDCDEIIVLHEGKVLEQGTHDELLRRGGRYTELLRMQQQEQLETDDAETTPGKDKNGS